jgi:hypothetical protein
MQTPEFDHRNRIRGGARVHGREDVVENREAAGPLPEKPNGVAVDVRHDHACELRSLGRIIEVWPDIGPDVRLGRYGRDILSALRLVRSQRPRECRRDDRPQQQRDHRSQCKTGFAESSHGLFPLIQFV